MKIELPAINASGVALGFTIRQVGRKVRAQVERLGPDNIRFLITNNQGLSSLPQVKERERELRRQALKFSRLAANISEEAFLCMLPPWCLSIVEEHGEQGQQWLREQLVWMRGFFKEA